MATRRTGKVVLDGNGNETVEFYDAQVPDPTPADLNRRTIENQARAALDANRAYVALAAPTAAQTTAQVKALSRQVNGAIRLLVNALDGTD